MGGGGGERGSLKGIRNDEMLIQYMKYDYMDETNQSQQ